ncbi:MAG TPA: hypothetical protein VJ861_02830 [Treponemataceae bacterium]|nr:hypothetical protein [Treponemataceae bacterium]
MTLPFYKLQLAGNGFILIDLVAAALLSSKDSDALGNPQFQSSTARLVCDKRYGIGATACIFLSGDNTIRIYTDKGLPAREADDALLCAARFAFDSGRIKNKTIVFSTSTGQRSLEVLGAHEFRLALGSPFALIGGKVITKATENLVEIIKHEGISTGYSAIHIREDIMVAFPQSSETFSLPFFSNLIQRAFPNKKILPVIARVITSDTIVIRTTPRYESGCTAAAVGSLIAAVCAGSALSQALVFFARSASETSIETILAKDRDNSQRIAAVWDHGDNEVYAIGSGGYLFEGKIDIPWEEII